MPRLKPKRPPRPAPPELEVVVTPVPDPGNERLARMLAVLVELGNDA